VTLKSIGKPKVAGKAQMELAEPGMSGLETKSIRPSGQAKTIV